MLSRHSSPRLVHRLPTDRFLNDTCRCYATRNEPAHAPICHRYHRHRGAHIPTRYVCSQYPKPARRNPIPTKQPPALSAGGVPEALSVAKYQDCYFDQIVDMIEETRQFIDQRLMQRTHQRIAAQERQPIVHQAQKPAPN